MSGGESLWRAQWSEHADPFAHLSGAHVARAERRGPGFQRALTSPSPISGEGGTRPHSGGGRVRARAPSESHTPAISLAHKARDDLSVGQRIFHGKFGYGIIDSIEGNKLEIEFEKAGRKRVLDSFVSLG